MCGGVSSRRRRHEARLAGGNSFGGVRRLGRKGGPGQADADRSNPHERRRHAAHEHLRGQRGAQQGDDPGARRAHRRAPGCRGISILDRHRQPGALPPAAGSEGRQGRRLGRRRGPAHRDRRPQQQDRAVRERARQPRRRRGRGQLHPGRPALRFLLGQRRQGVERRARARGDPAEDQPGRRGKEMKANERTGLSQLRSQRLRKRYKSRTVVQDVSLDVSSGEVVGLLGPNGAGKTTCFYMIVGLIPVDAGSIHLDATELTHLPIHRRARLGISYLPQENSVFRRLTVEENVQAILELQGPQPGGIEPRLVELLKDLNIAHLRKHAAISLSGGERRRLEIARALATKPAFILLDEPFAGVDPIAVLDIQRIIRFLKERGIGVLITDHNVRETLGICDRAYIINEGAVPAAPDIDWSAEIASSWRGPDDDEDGDRSFTAPDTPTLRDHLRGQLSLTNLGDRDRVFVQLLIDAVDEDGYLTQPLEEIAALLPAEAEADLEELGIALRHLQNLEPAGVGARSPRECLALQLRIMPDEPARRLALDIVEKHLELLASRDYTRLKRSEEHTSELQSLRHLVCRLLLEKKNNTRR